MKKIILAALIAGSSFASNAQKIELGLNGGIAPYIWADKTFKNYPGTTKYKPGFYGAFKTGLILGGWQVGVGAEMFQTRIEAINTTTTPNDFKNATRYQNLTPYLFANKLFRLPKSFIYAGLNGGFNTGFSETKVSGLFNYSEKDKHTGYNAGVQAGYTVNLVKGLGVNAEAGARYLVMKGFNKGNGVPHIIFPVSLGIRYTF